MGRSLGGLFAGYACLRRPDVFGNAMLLSRTTRLVAAFNHAHIFIDPEPDPDRSFQERKRLFDLPRSSWRDYDASLISAGGGVSFFVSSTMCTLLESIDRG